MRVGGQRHTPAALPRNDPVPIVQEAGWAPGPVWTAAENLAPPGFDPQIVQLVAGSVRTKIRLFNTNVKSVLLYGCETWKVLRRISDSLQVFVNRCLRRIVNVKWLDKIPDEALWQRAKQTEGTAKGGKTMALDW